MEEGSSRASYITILFPLFLLLNLVLNFPYPRIAEILQHFYTFLSGIVFHFIMCEMLGCIILCRLSIAEWQSTPPLKTTIVYSFSSHICKYLRNSCCRLKLARLTGFTHLQFVNLGEFFSLLLTLGSLTGELLLFMSLVFFVESGGWLRMFFSWQW